MGGAGLESAYGREVEETLLAGEEVDGVTDGAEGGFLGVRHGFIIELRLFVCV